MISEDIKRILQKQHYKIVGKHSAVKICHWLKLSLLDKNVCYKEQFYGISCHRCLQFTPAVSWCTHRCLFCWRSTESTLSDCLSNDEIDEPKKIIDESILAQRKLLNGYRGILDRVNKKKLLEAENPNQAAISLAGEPMSYPKMSELLEEFKRRNFTTFLVTNGSFPDRLQKLSALPTQLYVSLIAPDKVTFKKLCCPTDKSDWKKFNETIGLLPSFDTRKVVRITLVKGMNNFMHDKFAKMIHKAEPDFVEIKSYMFIGGSRKRLSFWNMPSFDETMDFSKELNDHLSYEMKDEKRDSRVVLLSKNKKIKNIS